MKAKCALCGGEWELGTGIYVHELVKCPLNMCCVGSYPVIESINAAIDAAKVDKRKMDECGDFDEIDGSMVHCNHVAAYVPVEMCPCSAHTRGRTCLK